MFFFDPMYLHLYDPGLRSDGIRLLVCAACLQQVESGTCHQWSDRSSGGSTIDLHWQSLWCEVQGTGGQLSDHYDPRNKTLFLSQGVASSPSVAAVAIAAHELGHALQDAEEYFPMKVRSMLVPAVNIGSNLGWILIMIGLVLQQTNIAWIGVLVFSGGALFSLGTLPVEFNASARAKQLLYQTGIIQTEEERRGSIRCSMPPHSLMSPVWSPPSCNCSITFS